MKTLLLTLLTLVTASNFQIAEAKDSGLSEKINYACGQAVSETEIELREFPLLYKFDPSEEEKEEASEFLYNEEKPFTLKFHRNNNFEPLKLYKKYCMWGSYDFKKRVVRLNDNGLVEKAYYDYTRD